MNEIEKIAKRKKQEKINNAIFLMIFILVMWLVVYSIWYNMMPPKIDESLIETYNLNKDLLPEPKQELLEEKETFTKKIAGVSIKVEKIATYDIIGRVEATKNYSKSLLASFLSWESAGIAAINKISPRDLTLSWGKLALNENSELFTADQYVTNGYRMVMGRYDGRLTEKLPREYVNSHFSNNHVIVLDKENEKALMKIKNNDIVRIIGYLVYVETSDGATWGPSSLSRTDEGCEILLADQIIIMKNEQK